VQNLLAGSEWEVDMRANQIVNKGIAGAASSGGRWAELLAGPFPLMSITAAFAAALGGLILPPLPKEDARAGEGEPPR
jgi:hypothetical protein